jgi:hypothetical protein
MSQAASAINYRLGSLYSVVTAFLYATQEPFSFPAARHLNTVQFVCLTQIALLVSIPFLTLPPPSRRDFLALIRAPSNYGSRLDVARTGGRWPLRFKTTTKPKRSKRNVHFARRNKRFRMPSRKSLKSLLDANQSFRGIVCFQGLNLVLLSRFSRAVCFQWLSSLPVSPREISSGSWKNTS